MSEPPANSVKASFWSKKEPRLVLVHKLDRIYTMRETVSKSTNNLYYSNDTFLSTRI